MILGKNGFKSPLARGIVVALIAAGFAGLARCQDTDLPRGATGRAPMPEYIQEFFLSDAVRSQDKREVQFTFATYSQQGVGSNAEVHVEYGFTERLQISVEVPYGITRSQQEDEDGPGWNAVRLGTLYQIIRSDQPFALSAGIMIEVPVRPGDELGLQPTILLAKTFRKLQIHTSVLSNLTGSRTELEYNVASVYPIKRHWFPTFEFNGRWQDVKNAFYLTPSRLPTSELIAPRENVSNWFYLTPGLYRHFKHRLEIGIGIPIGVGGVAGSVGIVAKMNWEHGGEQ